MAFLRRATDSQNASRDSRVEPARLETCIEVLHKGLAAMDAGPMLIDGSRDGSQAGVNPMDREAGADVRNRAPGGGQEGGATILTHPKLGESDMALARELTPELAKQVGRMIVEGLTTCLMAPPIQQHRGPYPAALDERNPSTGAAAAARFLRPITFQDVPSEVLAT